MKRAEINIASEIVFKNNSMIMENRLLELISENEDLKNKLKPKEIDKKPFIRTMDVDTMTILELENIIKEFKDVDCQTVEDNWEGKYKDLKIKYKETIDKANERIRKKELIFDVKRKEFMTIHAINEQVNRYGDGVIGKDIIEPVVVALNVLADSNPNSNFGDTMKMVSILLSKIFMKLNK